MNANPCGKWKMDLGESSGGLSLEGRKVLNLFPQNLEQDLLWFYLKAEEHLHHKCGGILGWVQLLEEARERCLCWISHPTEQTQKEKQLQFYHFSGNSS